MTEIHSSGTTGEAGGELLRTMSLGFGKPKGERVGALMGLVYCFQLGDRNLGGGLDRVDELL